MQLLQVFRLLAMAGSGLLGLGAFGEFPLIFDMICCMKWPPVGDLIPEPNALLCPSSLNKLLSGVRGDLPLFFPFLRRSFAPGTVEGCLPFVSMWPFLKAFGAEET